MRRKGHPSFPNAITCCFFSSLKTLLMPREPIRAPLGVNVPGSAMAGFQPTSYGRFWVTTEADAGIHSVLLQGQQHCTLVRGLRPYLHDLARVSRHGPSICCEILRPWADHLRRTEIVWKPAGATVDGTGSGAAGRTPGTFRR